MDLQPLDLPSVKPASALSPEAQTSSLRLHGSKTPVTEIVTQKPWHQAAAMLFARGEVSYKEVAEAFDVTPATISNLVRQQWFQERVLQLMAEHGGRDIMQLFKGEAWNSLNVLVALRDNEKIPAAVRAGSAKDILDRALGKPVQRIEDSRGAPSPDPVAEAKRLEESNARLRKTLSSS